MIFLLFLLIFYFIILMSFIFQNNLMNLKTFNKMEIECGMFGFLNKNSSSFIYMLFLIVFLIFDLEVILFFFLMNNFMGFIYVMILLFILFSLILELFESSIKWND